MSLNLAHKVYEAWRNYRYPPKHRQLKREFSNLQEYFGLHPHTKPEDRIRQFREIANEQSRNYKRWILIGAGLTILGYGTVIFSPDIINEVKNFSEYLGRIAPYIIQPVGYVLGTGGLAQLIRNLSLNSEMRDYIRYTNEKLKGPKKIV